MYWRARRPFVCGASYFTLKQAPGNPLGEFAYSNAGYLVAGAMLEAAGGDSWETLVSRHVGSNDRWLAQVLIIPQRDVAIFMVTNAARNTADGGRPMQALQDIGDWLMRRMDAVQDAAIR